MAGTEIAKQIPPSCIAGDTWEFDWGNEKWKFQPNRTAEMVIGRGPFRMATPGVPYGTSVDSRWKFMFASSATANVPQAGYQYYIIIHDLNARHVAETGVLTVLGNPFGTDPVRPISMKRAQYEAGNVTFLQLLNGETEEVQFSGHRYRMWNILEFKEVLDRLKRELDLLEPDIDIGGGRGNRMLAYHRMRDI